MSHGAGDLHPGNILVRGLDGTGEETELQLVLLDAGIDVDVRDLDGKTAYDRALDHRSIRAAEAITAVVGFDFHRAKAAAGAAYITHFTGH